MADDSISTIDPKASARWHAAVAIQGNKDALAVLGGCLRTGTGVASVYGNPSGADKKAAMMEANDDYVGARGKERRMRCSCLVWDIVWSKEMASIAILKMGNGHGVMLLNWHRMRDPRRRRDFPTAYFSR